MGKSVNEAFGTILEFWKTGQSSLRDVPRVGMGDRAKIIQQAARIGMNLDTFEKSRVFADKNRGFTRAELDDLKTKMREHGSPIGPTHIIRLLRLPRGKRRDDLLERTLREKLSASQLTNVILTSRGPKRSGGRRKRLPDSVNELMVHLEGMAASWLRTNEQLHSKPGSTPGGTKFDKLPKEVSRAFETATEAVRKLLRIAGLELAKQRCDEDSRATHVPVSWREQ